MERFSTIGLPAAGKVTAWNNLYSSRMSRVEFTPADQEQFDAQLSICTLGPVKLAKLSVDRCTVERTRQHLAQSPRLYSFLLQAKGNSLFYHYGHESHLSEGDLVLCDTGMPHSFHAGTRSETIMVRVLPDVLREYMPALEQFCGLHLRKEVGVTGTVAAMVQSLSEQIDLSAYPDYEGRVARSLLEMISISYTMGFDDRPSASAMVWRRRKDVIRYIENNLRDPALTAESVADGVHLSPRYLRTIFSDSGEKLSDYIRRRRVEECARKLRDPAWSGRTLMTIAFSCGFNSAAHFSRCFRERFQVSPSDYRRDHE
jgi:AraC family transcriptional activator of tynA and feaB